jgi:chemotaxis protein methyltransferase CheR
MSSFTLSFDDFDALRQLIREHCGIWLGDSKVTFLQVRLADRLRARNISSAQEYYYFLKYDAHGHEEMQRLIDAVTVNETWFFRETGPIDAWRKTVLPDLIKRSGRLRMWSAGCATGEEPYTLAMLLLEDYPATAAARFEILATDISQRALEAARAGVYDPYSLRHTEPYWLAKYFQPASGGRQEVCENVRRLVRFGQANLIDPALAQRVRAMDAILCRNVIIYLDDQSRRAALTNFYAALKPAGHLMLGHSESLVHTVTPFEVARVGGTIMYRKNTKT